MFLAIINDTYSDVKNDMTTQKSEFELGEYFKKSYGKMLDRLRIKKDVSIIISSDRNSSPFVFFQRVIDIQNALKTADVNKDGVIEVSESDI